ncbi:MAG: hypothetical protein GXO24_07245 [Chlorobi bacterium]|nr:hypothetical protein [Chlorobiota bacterium]
MQSFWQKNKLYILGFGLFLVTAFVLYSPLLQGKKLVGSDTLQFWAMEHERKVYTEQKGGDVYWTNAVFGGMPTYLLGAGFPNDLPAKVNKIWRVFPKPVNYLFIYFLGFLLLMWVLGVRPLPALAGAFGFTLSTYLIIILQVGHFAKASAVAYFPWVMAGVLLIVRRKKYALGFVVLALSMALEIGAKHYQMTYYLGLALLLYGLWWLADVYRNGAWKEFLTETALMLGAVVLGIGMNYASMAAIKEYISQSIRGEQFVKVNPDGTPKETTSGGLDKNYITEYSYGLAETFNLFIPGFTGGSNREKLGEGSHIYRALIERNVPPSQAKEFAASTSLYWGDQPIVMAPAYIGAVIIFLAVLGFFLYKGRLRNWILTVTVFALLLSWGKNLPWLTDLFIDYFPYYNKFRAVASIQVLLEWLLPVMAVLGLMAWLDPEIDARRKEKVWKYTAYGLGGLALLFFLLGPSLFSFQSAQDGIYEQYKLLDALIADRQSLLRWDSSRSLLFVGMTALMLWGILKGKIKKEYALGVIIALVIFDLGGVAKRYIRDDHFMTKRQIDRFFRPSPVDKAIMQDKSYYRVVNFARNPLTDGLTSYFHKNLGGYHAAKPRRIQDIFDFYINGKVHYPVLNMYNTKYIIFKGDKGTAYQANPAAFGPAWLVDSLRLVPDQTAEILALKDTDLRRTAVVENVYPALKSLQIQPDSADYIRFEKYHPEHLTYKSHTKHDRLAVFSENYYPYGWKGYIDGRPAEIYKADYSLRAMLIPAGEHRVEMRFEPEVIRKGAMVNLVFVLLFALSVLIWIYSLWKERKKA